MNDNPYQSPRSQAWPESSDDRLATFQEPPYKLFKSWHVVLATFLGSLLAGGILMALNFQRLGRPQAAWQTLALSIVGTFAMFGVLMFLPELPIPQIVYSVPQMAVMFFISERLFGDEFHRHERLLGQWSSGWAAAGIAILTSLLLVAIIFGGLLMLEAAWPGILPVEV